MWSWWQRVIIASLGGGGVLSWRTTDQPPRKQQYDIFYNFNTSESTDVPNLKLEEKNLRRDRKGTLRVDPEAGSDDERGEGSSQPTVLAVENGVGASSSSECPAAGSCAMVKITERRLAVRPRRIV